MRIPPSVIVMSAVTAVPFGMAIRDARSPKLRVPLVDPVQAAVATQQEVRKEAALAAIHAERVRLIGGLVGAKPVTPGPTLAGVSPGEPRTGSLDLPSAQVAVRLGRDQRVVGIELELAPSDCEILRDRLTTSWGPGAAWFDREHHHRASLNACDFELESYVDPPDWLAFAHDELVGKSLDRALEVLGPAETVDDNAYIWSLPGLGLGAGITQLDLYVEDGKVIGMKLQADAPRDDASAVHNALAEKLHARPSYDDRDFGRLHVWSWTHRTPAIAFESDDRAVQLTIGATP